MSRRSVSDGSSNPQCCRNGWITYDESCYFVGRTQKTWGEAAGYCRNFDANLMVVDSNEEWVSENRYLYQPKMHVVQPESGVINAYSLRIPFDLIS